MSRLDKIFRRIDETSTALNCLDFMNTMKDPIWVSYIEEYSKRYNVEVIIAIFCKNSTYEVHTGWFDSTNSEEVQDLNSIPSLDEDDLKFLLHKYRIFKESLNGIPRISVFDLASTMMNQLEKLYTSIPMSVVFMQTLGLLRE